MKVNKYVLCTKNEEQTLLLGTQLAKLNFKLEGTMQDCEVKNGEFISLDIYSIFSKR